MFARSLQANQVNLVTINILEARKLTTAEYKLIEDEHSRLSDSLQNIRSTCRNLDNHGNCQSCSRERIATCQGRLISFFYNIINITTNHFSHEESIMRRLSVVTEEYEDFRSHQQAHNNILNELNAKISLCALLDAHGETAEAYRQLYKRMSELFEEHARLLDDPFIKSTQP